MRIGIIGAGVSGLVTAKTLIEYQHDVVVFEKEKELGGVWCPSRHYPGMTTQNTRDTYAFSDFRMPKEYPEFPSGAQVFDYLKNM
jgi:dimethylaniline monooxygenase (N-oxide forming)